MFITVMGVCGCGKTSVGRGIAQHLKVSFLEGDAFHPPQNIRKMSQGIALDDTDRAPWLQAMADKLAALAQQQGQAGAVLACSALKRSYRDILRQGHGELCFIHLYGERDLIAQRMAARTDHYMPVTLLDSQLAILEPPDADERHISVAIDLPLAVQITAAVNALQQLP
jgi:gluconokinase